VKNLTWQNPEQLFVAQELINKVKSKCCGIKEKVKKLRSVWQLQSHVSYCLYGSKKHILEQMFQNASYPFYRFGDFFYLNKISEKDWVEYICQRFESTGKHISEELAREICQVTDRYSSYVQQLAWFV